MLSEAATRRKEVFYCIFRVAFDRHDASELLLKWATTLAVATLTNVSTDISKLPSCFIYIRLFI